MYLDLLECNQAGPTNGLIIQLDQASKGVATSVVPSSRFCQQLDPGLPDVIVQSTVASSPKNDLILGIALFDHSSAVGFFFALHVLQSFSDIEHVFGKRACENVIFGLLRSGLYFWMTELRHRIPNLSN